MTLSLALLAVLAAMALTLLRALRGPTVWDRILAVNMSGTMTVLLICVLGFVVERPDFLDIAMIYALLSFVGTIAVLRFFASSGRERPQVEPRGPRPGLGEEQA